MTIGISPRTLRLTLLVAICISPFCTEGLALAQQTNQTSTTDDKADTIAFRVFFRIIITYKKLSEEAQIVNQNKSYLRRIIPDRLKLNDRDVNRLEWIAMDCENELSPLEKEARDVIKNFRIHFPQSGVPSGTNISPPPELMTLQLLEDSVVLRHRDLLKSEMNLDVYKQIEKEVRHMFAGGITPVQNSSRSIIVESSPVIR